MLGYNKFYGDMATRRLWVCIVGTAVVVAGIVSMKRDLVLNHHADLQTQKQHQMESYGHPDQFLLYHADIRTSEDGPEYPPNYRMEEFNKAVAWRKAPGVPIGWVERGPSNVPGRTRALVLDPDDPTGATWFSGGAGGGLWRTNNAGETWQNLTDHLPNLAVSALAISDTDLPVLYMGTGEGFGHVGAIVGSGIFRSDDKGGYMDSIGGYR